MAARGDGGNWGHHQCTTGWCCATYAAIRRALADELLFGRLVDGGRLTVDVDDKGEIQLDIQPPKKNDKARPEITAA